MKKTTKLVSSLVVGSIGSLAQATPITVSDTVTLGNLLQNTSDVVRYDASNLLASSGLSANELLSGSLVVYGLSNIDYQTNVGGYGGYATTGSSSRFVSVPYTYYTYVYVPGHSYSCGFGGWSTCYYGGYGYSVQQTGYYGALVYDYTETRQREIDHLDTQDTMTVSVGGATASAVDSVVAHSRDYSAPVYQYSDYYGPYSSTYTYYQQDVNVYDSVSGPLQLSLALDALALTSLRDNGYIDIDVSAAGQFTLESIKFTASAAAVPEPASITLALAGVAAFGASRLRKKTKGQ
jgi:hypothetical protein